jgi:hypothetical protein
VHPVAPCIWKRGVWILCLFFAGRAAGADAKAPRIRLTDKGGAIEVAGLGAKALKALTAFREDTDRWKEVFVVRVDRKGVATPPMLGTYRVVGDAARFEPRFPLARGVPYRVLFRPGKLPGGTGDPVEKVLLLPKTPPTEPTRVARVYPSTDVLPENQLKFYLHFSAPMSQGNVYRHIHLIDAKGKEVKWPFLELGEELWDPQATRFTLLFDPGRIKRGLKPREEMGPPLIEGHRYTLVIDKEWLDAEGFPLKETYKKAFRVAAPDDTQPDPKKWKLAAPPAGGKKPLAVAFPEPMEHALVSRMLTVTDAKGRAVAGKVRISDKERRWEFTPGKAWRAGDYFLVIDTRLEDLAGNSLARPFEVDVFGKVTKKLEVKTVKLPFTVKGR